MVVAAPIVIVGVLVYPVPALLILIDLTVPPTITASAVAFTPPSGAVPIATFGVVVYPEPPEVIVTIPMEPCVDTPAVAIPVPGTVTVGIPMYPLPGLIKRILSIDFAVAIPDLSVMIATAVASVPTDVVIPIVGAAAYPNPSSCKNIC